MNSDVLTPSPESVLEAECMNAKAFKLFPRYTYKAPNNSYKDEDNPLGVRGGGSYFSFTTGSHSYNKIPQIFLGEKHDLGVGFYGDNMGLLQDLGEVPLDKVSVDDPSIAFLVNYEPPKPIAEIKSEHTRLGHPNLWKELGFKWRGHLTYAKAGRTYLVRAISFYEADVLVVFTVLRKLPDDSLELAWRMIREYPVPEAWHFTDDELREKLRTILAKDQFRHVYAEVKDYEITVRGRIDKRTEMTFRGELNSIRKIKLKFIQTENYDGSK